MLKKIRDGSFTPNATSTTPTNESNKHDSSNNNNDTYISEAIAANINDDDNSCAGDDAMQGVVKLQRPGGLLGFAYSDDESEDEGAEQRYV